MLAIWHRDIYGVQSTQSIARCERKWADKTYDVTPPKLQVQLYAGYKQQSLSTRHGLDFGSAGTWFEVQAVAGDGWGGRPVLRLGRSRLMAKEGLSHPSLPFSACRDPDDSGPASQHPMVSCPLSVFGGRPKNFISE